MRSVIMKKVDQSFFLMKDKGVVGLILPSYVHRGGTKVPVPGIPDMLTDGIKKIVDRKGFKSFGSDQHRVGEQSVLFLVTQKWKAVTGGPVHDVIMDSSHMGSHTVQIHYDQDISKTRRCRDFLPWVAEGIMTLWRVRLPHGVVPWTWSFAGNVSGARWINHIGWGVKETGERRDKTEQKTKQTRKKKQ